MDKALKHLVDKMDEEVRIRPSNPPHAVDPIRHIRILIVDDDPATQDMIRSAIQARNINIDTASTMMEALSLLESADILVTDYVLTSQRDAGQSLVAQWQRLKPDRPAIVVSAYLDERVQQALYSAGATTVIDKAVMVEVIDRIVRRYVDYVRLQFRLEAVQQTNQLLIQRGQQLVEDIERQNTRLDRMVRRQLVVTTVAMIVIGLVATAISQSGISVDTLFNLIGS